MLPDPSDACGVASRALPDYLTELLNRYWFAPPVALWRAIELRTAAQERYEFPLLDLGCGDGLVAEAFFGDTSGVGGVDLELDQLRQAVRRRIYQHVVLADAAHLPYRNGTFRTVFSNSVLEHIPAVEPVLTEVSRVLQSGGRFIFTVPSDAFPHLLDGWIRNAAQGDVQKAEEYVHWVNEWLAHYHYYSPSEWERLLARSRMKLRVARYYIPEKVERFWDRANWRYGLMRRWTLWRLLSSPRMRRLGFQLIVQRIVVHRLSRTWRPMYEQDVPLGEVGGGLLLVAERQR